MFAQWKKRKTAANEEKPLEKLTILTSKEAGERIDQQEQAAAAATSAATAAAAAQKKKAHKPRGAKAAGKAAAAAPTTPTPVEMNAADRAIERMQRDQINQYMRRHQNNLQWLLLSKKLQQSLAHTVIAESASDLSKGGSH